MNISHRTAIAALALSALCILGIIVLTALHQVPPPVLQQLALGAAFAGAGIASPLTGSTAAAVVEAADNVTVSTSGSDLPTPPAAPAAPPAYTAPAGG